MKNEVNPDDLEEGQILQYEEKYYAAAVAKILTVEYEERESDSYQRVEIEILDPIFGNLEEGETLKLGRTTNNGLQHYIDWKFKNPGEMTDYCNAAELDEHRQKMNEIEEKYGEE